MKTPIAFAAAALTAAALSSFPAAAANVQSISKIAFGPNNTLFVADWRGAKIHALSLPAATQSRAAPFNIFDLESLLARSLGDVRVTVTDMAVRPGTGQAYVAVEYGVQRTPALFIVTTQKRGLTSPLSAFLSDPRLRRR